MGLLSDNAAAMQAVADVLMVALQQRPALSGSLLLLHHTLDRAAASDVSSNVRVYLDIPCDTSKPTVQVTRIKRGCRTKR